MTVLVTGSAGFIGNALALRLLESGETVVGLDNVSPYYDVLLKEARLARLTAHKGFSEVRIALENRDAVLELFRGHRFSLVLHMAAQAGVRYSLENPWAYTQSNIGGFLNILEGCRQQGIPHLVFASSSSVYGANSKLPFSVHDPVDHPISLYAATKRANELMAHAYSHLYRIPSTGVRFFTVYGPWGRPDMAPILFARAILAGEPISVFNHGRMRRDFTYIDDAVEAVMRVAARPPAPQELRSEWPSDPARSQAPFRLYNIGNHQPVELDRFIALLERALGRSAIRHGVPAPAADVVSTFADVSELEQDTGLHPSTSIEEGIVRFVDWYRDFYRSS